MASVAPASVRVEDVEKPLYVQKNNSAGQRLKRCKLKSHSRNRMRRLRR